MELSSGVRFGAQIAAAAGRHGLDPKLLAAVAAQESGGPDTNSGRNVVGDGGHGHGLFQLDDRSWAFASSSAALDPAANADAAAGILRDDLDRYGGNVRAALSAYNSGSPAAAGTPTTWGDGQTLSYADSVMRHYAALGGDPAQLLADGRDTSQSVNALANYGATQPATAGSSQIAAAESGLSPLASSVAAPSLGSLGSAGIAEPPMIQATSQSPFAPPISWANETSANGPAGGKEAADADGLVANSIDSSDGALDDSGGGDGS
jgi:hypothetical protein